MIDGTAYVVHAEVAAELLRLHIELQTAPQAVQPAVPFMHGIADGCGNAYFEEGCVAPEARDLQPDVDGLNSCLDDDERPYSVVPLYTQPAAQGLNARIYTYKNQPTDNVVAWRFGEACANAKPGGDYIDHGLSLLQQLEQKGYGLVELAAQAKQGGAA